MDLRRYNDDARAIIRSVITDGRPQDLRITAKFLDCASTAIGIRGAYEAFDFLTPEFWSWLKGRKVGLSECFGLRQVAETEDGRYVTATIVDFEENGCVVLEDDDGQRWHGFLGGFVVPIDQPPPSRPPREWCNAEGAPTMPHWYDAFRES